MELQNSKNSLDSYDIVSGRKSHLTLYPGNVAVIEPEVKQMVTVSGRIRAEDGTLLANARINNHIGRTRTDENGEFVMDVDKKYPTIDFSYGGNKTCEVALELSPGARRRLGRGCGLQRPLVVGGGAAVRRRE